MQVEQVAAASRRRDRFGTRPVRSVGGEQAMRRRTVGAIVMASLVVCAVAAGQASARPETEHESAAYPNDVNCVVAKNQMERAGYYVIPISQYCIENGQGKFQFLWYD
ncbi:hypothetical protein [Kribbella sp. NPDC055071]